MAVIASMHLKMEIVQLKITCKAFSFLWTKEIHLILILICFATYRLEYGQFPQYSPPVGMTPELGYHPAHVFPAAALHVAAEQKRNDFLAAMNKQNLMQKESVSPKNADEAEKNEEAIKTTKIDGLGVSGEFLVRMHCNYINSLKLTLPCWLKVNLHWATEAMSLSLSHQYAYPNLAIFSTDLSYFL